MEKINLKINGKDISVAKGTTIMEAAKANNISIPNLCYLENIHQFGACRICVVEVKGAKTLQASCMTAVTEGMDVQTNSDKVRKARKVLYELLLSDHTKDCLSCKRNQSCELQELGKTLGIEETRFEGERSLKNLDVSFSITRDMSKCVLCRRCVTACNEIQGVGILNAQNRGRPRDGFAAGHGQLRILRSVHGRLPGRGAERDRFDPESLERD